MILKLFIISLVSLPVISFAQSVPIFLDGKVDDWNVPVPTYTDTEGDGNNYDFKNFAVTNDEEFLFIQLNINPECKLMEDNLLSLYIDGDDDSTTGLLINGLGAELEWDFGFRNGTFYKNGSTVISYPDIIYRSLPTVTDTTYEIAIGRNALPNGTDSLFTSSTIKLFFSDNELNGDWMPDSGETFEYTFDESPTPPVDLIRINKEDTTLLRVMDWNVLNDGLTSSSRQQYFARILQAVNPDIICFSECVSSTAEDVKQVMDQILPLSNSQGWFTKKMDYDDVIASRYLIKQGWNYYPSDNRSFASLIDLPDYFEKDLLTVNAHLKCCGGEDNDDRRQREVDAIISFLKDAKTVGGSIDLPDGTPFIILGDLNLVGRRQQLVSLVTGVIINTGQFGTGGAPDWDDTDLEDLIAYQTDKRIAYTWRDDGSSYPPGRLDFQIFTNSVLNVEKVFLIQTEVMSPDRLATYGLQQFDSGNASDHFPKVTDYHIVLPTDVNDKHVPGNFILEQNYPNPFNPRTKISWQSPINSWQTLKLYDVLGIEIATLVDEFKPAGKYEIEFDANDLPSGVYFYQLKSGNNIATKKLILLK